MAGAKIMEQAISAIILSVFIYSDLRINCDPRAYFNSACPQVFERCLSLSARYFSLLLFLRQPMQFGFHI